jgi:2-polyprenyl-6-methoxyphenol hydroxylase-like FAD-dependent oxidoreductase
MPPRVGQPRLARYGPSVADEQSRALHAVVIGGGVAGLAVTHALSREGYRLTVLERDATPLPRSAVEAFESWDRRGAPQVLHSHAFLARLRNGLRERAPELLARLLENGAYEIRITDALPATIDDRAPRPGDDDLVLLGCRRTTFEWVLHCAARELPSVHWRDGTTVTGLDLVAGDEATLPRVAGVHIRTAGGRDETIATDLVIDASGRRSALPTWLAAAGVEPVPDESEECGIFYSSRFYRLLPGATEPPREGPIGADLGYMKFAIFSGDSRIFSVTLAASPEDAPMRSVLHPGPFEAAARAIPAIRPWLEPGRSEPITGVHGMAKLRNRRRRFVRDGRPLVLGVHAIGDAAICTNPLYGRGCTLAFVHAWLLADALRDHGEDPEACALALEEGTRREILPWYKSAVMQDREAREVAAAQRRGAAATPAAPDQPVDPRAFMRSVLRDGLLPALRTDATVLRAFLRNFNLLETPDWLLANGDVMRRVLAAWRERDQRAPDEPLGPLREEMVRLLEEAAA